MAATAAAAMFGLAACGSGGGNSSSGGAASQAPATSSSAPSTSSSANASPASAPFGPGCSAVPKSGKGSFKAMSQAPVATAASNNPALSTLVTAVKKAGLVDTLNNAQGITVFAPSNKAFDQIPKDKLQALLKNKDKLTMLLKGHVVGKTIQPSDLSSGKFTSLAKTTITSMGSGKDFTVDGNAKVVCGNVQTANATVYIVDHVLMPKAKQ